MPAPPPPPEPPVHIKVKDDDNPPRLGARLRARRQGPQVPAEAGGLAPIAAHVAAGAGDRPGRHAQLCGPCLGRLAGGITGPPAANRARRALRAPPPPPRGATPRPRG